LRRKYFSNARNSILLVDFIRHGAGCGKALREVLFEAGAVRFKPILLTALAAMIGAATILLDPIFKGLRSRCCSASPHRLCSPSW
jgi:multidrug efflux pump subunit AcrB